MQLLPLLVLFLFTFMSMNWGGQPDPLYSLHQTDPFNVERKTNTCVLRPWVLRLDTIFNV
jgi:hypothetical protein